MKSILGVGLAALLILAGCGGSGEEDDAPATLEGPATLTSVQDCLDQTGLFPRLEVSDNRAKQSIYPPLLLGYYGKQGSRFILTFYPTAREARLVELSDPAFDRSIHAVSMITNTPTIGLHYPIDIPDEKLAAVKICTTETYADGDSELEFDNDTDIASLAPTTQLEAVRACVEREAPYSEMEITENGRRLPPTLRIALDPSLSFPDYSIAAYEDEDEAAAMNDAALRGPQIVHRNSEIAGIPTMVIDWANTLNPDYSIVDSDLELVRKCSSDPV